MTTDDDLLRKARALPRSVPPARDLWPDIAAHLEETAPAVTSADAVRVAGIEAQRPSGRRWQPLAVAAGLILAVTVGFWLGRELEPTVPDVAVHGGPTPATAGLTPVAADLHQTRTALAGNIESRLAELNPATRDVVLDNLATINQALDDIDAALASAPDSGLDSRLLMAMYADQLVLLNTMNNALYTATPEIAL